MSIEELIKLNKLDEAFKEIKGNSEEDCYYKALIYFKKEQYSDCLMALIDCLKQTDKLFYPATILKVDCLDKLGKSKDALNIVNEELSMPYIPSPYQEELEERFKYLNSLNAKNDTFSKYDRMLNEELGDLLLKTSIPEELLSIAYQLSKRNIRTLLPYIKEFLISDANDFYKTIFLEQLLLQGVNEEIKVVKNGLELDVYPTNLTPVLELDSFKEIQKCIEKFEENKNITVIKNAGAIAMMYISKVYPVDIEKEEYEYVALASLIISSSNLGIDVDKNKYLDKYDLLNKVLEGYLKELSIN